MSKRTCSFCGQTVADHKGPTGIRCPKNTAYDFDFVELNQSEGVIMSVSSTPAKNSNSEDGASAIDAEKMGKSPKQSLDETLSALEEENEKLLEELKLRELVETNKSLKQKLKQTGSKPKQRVDDDESSKFDLGLLRKDKGLKQKITEKQKSLVGKLLSSDEDSDSDADSEGEAQLSQTLKSLNYPKFKLKKNKNISKSGSSRKSSDKAIFHVAWPHEFAGSDDVEFMSLSMPALVRGENYIIHNVEPAEYRDKRAEHLTQLMFYSEQFIWSDVLAFHKDVLREIETGHASWNDNFDFIKSRRLHQSHPKFYCSAYNKGSCSKKEAHKNTLGLLEEHFCSSCWIKRKSVMHHAAKDCQNQKQARGRGSDGNLQQDRDFQGHGRGRGTDGYAQNWQQDRR